MTLTRSVRVLRHHSPPGDGGGGGRYNEADADFITYSSPPQIAPLLHRVSGTQIEDDLSLSSFPVEPPSSSSRPGPH